MSTGARSPSAIPLAPPEPASLAPSPTRCSAATCSSAWPASAPPEVSAAPSSWNDRSHMAVETLPTTQPGITCAIDPEAIATILIDQPGEKVNVMNLTFIEELEQ